MFKVPFLALSIEHTAAWVYLDSPHAIRVP